MSADCQGRAGQPAVFRRCPTVVNYAAFDQIHRLKVTTGGVDQAGRRNKRQFLVFPKLREATGFRVQQHIATPRHGTNQNSFLGACKRNAQWQRSRRFVKFVVSGCQKIQSIHATPQEHNDQRLCLQRCSASPRQSKLLASGEGCSRGEKTATRKIHGNYTD